MLEQEKNYDVLVIGGGIAGIESALKLGDMGYKILLVEKDATVGGHMILLSKVFPTLDCSACITTPKVSEIARHPNVTIITISEVQEIEKLGEKRFSAKILEHPRYVKENLCTGCQECERVCPSYTDDQYQLSQVARKAVYIPFDIASPRIALIDIENCILCGACEKVCAPEAIDFTQEEIITEIEVKSVVVATGFQLFDPTIIERYGYGKYKNVVTSMQMERQLAPTRPFNTVMRPQDAKVPDNIAYVLCTGSRDNRVGTPICSQICCMYSTKQSQLLMGALPMADVSIYYLHIRAFGKGFCEFYQQTVGMGVEFIKGKVGKITEKPNGNLILRYEDIETGKVKETEHDMVVLSVGVLANPEITKVFTKQKLEIDPYSYIHQSDELANPAKTSIDGVFVSGTASGPMDIPDSIMSAATAASGTSNYIKH
ncbi:MAG: CoB--CoM heterodisulfide reductase iron-sulfur subunit A family protein [Bacteroidota bacterium]|nr:CoB--CoM heterodisulfide reductase iron-sulfur subunit A family protein [Bacteroidota bacterium]